MRIIDKNTDFYDYLQNVYRDDSITFDRTDSFVLTKEMMSRYLFSSIRYPELHDYKFLLLQVCNTFWIFVADLTAISKDIYGSDKVSDYNLELLATWKNYNKVRELIKLDVISIKFGLWMDIRKHPKYKYHYSKYKYDKEKILNNLDTVIKLIDTNDYRIDRSIDSHSVQLGNGTWVKKHIPLLKACGVAKLIDPLEIYIAFEEFFSLEKTASERTESVGITDKEKIENHGFDTKTSFRGK